MVCTVWHASHSGDLRISHKTISAGIQTSSFLPYLNPTKRSGGMRAAFLVCGSDCGVQVGCIDVLAERDPPIVVETVISKRIHREFPCFGCIAGDRKEI